MKEKNVPGNHSVSEEIKATHLCFLFGKLVVLFIYFFGGGGQYLTSRKRIEEAQFHIFYNI